MNEPDCLTDFQRQLVLSLFPAGSIITKADWMQWMRPCPVAVDVRLAGDGPEQRVVLRRSRNPGGVEREALVLPELARLGLPVPRLLAAPSTDPKDDETVSVLSFLPGVSLQDFAMRSEASLVTARTLAVQAINSLHSVTDSMWFNLVASEALGKVPKRRVWLAWRREQETWDSQPDFGDTLRQRMEIASRNTTLRTRIVFSNGDYQPGNFLTDGEDITGLLDFEKAGFADPLMNVARFPVYGIEPLNGAGIAAAFCDANGFTDSDLAIRVVIFGLRTLRTKLPVDAAQDAPQQREFRARLLGVIRTALDEVKD
jgi:aminoglycoside phosphotransferase (APT) family kinase protein